MALDGCRGGLRGTQEANKGSSVPPMSKHKAEQLQSDPRLGAYAPKDTNLPNSLPATVCYQLAPHVLSYAAQHDSPTEPDVGTFMGNVQSSSICHVTSSTPYPFQQGEDHSEVVSDYRHSYTARVLPYPHQNSPCLFPDPFYIATQQLQNNMGDSLLQRELRTGALPSGADSSYSHKRAAHNLLRSFQGSASTNFSAGVTEFARAPADVSKQPRIPSTPRGDPHEQPLLWLEDGITTTPYHRLRDDSAAESTQKPVTLNIWETSSQLASEEHCCLHLDDYNTSKHASVVECTRAGAGGSSEEVICSGPCLPTLGSGCTTDADVEEKRCLQVTQPPAAFAGKGVELEDPSQEVRQRSNIKKRATLIDVLPVASPFRPDGCAIPHDNGATQEDTGIFDVCWRAIQPGSERCEGASQVQQPAGETDQRLQDAGQRRGVLDATSVLTQCRTRDRLCCSISEGRSVGSPRKAWVPNTKIEQQETQKITAFIAALHSFLSSVDPFAEVKDQLTVADVAEAVSVSRHSDSQSGQDLFAAESVELQVVPVGASRETPVLRSTHCTITGADSLVAQAAPTSDAALGTLENKCSQLGPPSHAAGTCSQRTTYCSGVTAIGSGRSSYASAISFDRCASYSSCSSISGAGYSTSSTTMLLPNGNFEHKETENVASAACNSLLEYSSSSPQKCLERVMAGMAPCQSDYALAAAAAGSPTTIPKYASEKPGIEDLRFRNLVRAFYADNSRHSVLWDERQQRAPPLGSSAHGQLTAHRDCWMAATGITEVTHQVKALVNRLRGLELVTRELAAIPEPSGALCCCLSGHLVEHTVVAERAATGALARWKFEQLLVISVRDNDSTTSVQLEHEELPALRSEEIPSDSLTAVHAFQIQDEVFVVSPVYGSYTSSTKAVTVMSPLNGAAEQRASDTPSEEHSDGVSSALLHVHSTSAEEGSYQCPMRHGLTAFLKWKGQYGLREWSVSASGRTMSNILRSSCEEGDTARDTRNAGAAAIIQIASDSTSQVDTGQETLDAPCVQQAALQVVGENSSSSQQMQQHQINRLRAENTVPEFDASAQGSEMERNKRERVLETVELLDGDASVSRVTRHVESNTQLAKVATTTYNEQLIDTPCAEKLQLYPKQKVQDSADACVFSGGMQHDQSSTSGRVKPGFESRSPPPTLPALAALQEAATACPKRLINALLQCVQEFEIQGQTSSSVRVETGPLAVSKFFDKVTSTNANFEPYSSSLPVENVCEMQPPVPSSRLADTAAAGAPDNAVAPADTIIKHHGLIEWRPDNFSGERLLPSGVGDMTTDARGGLNSAKQGTQRRIWGGAGLDVGASRARAPRRRATRAEAKERNARLKSTPDVEDNLQSLGCFREHCTVFVSWVPRAARADDIKQKSSMETRLKLLLQMAMGVRGIVRVALFPPRGSHCCVLFESPAAASAFIQEYGGSTYTSTTEQFKADICAAYAVALDRGIERVFIRIEEFKPHVLQQPFPQQTRDRSTPAAREWHERRRECATALQPPSGRWRHQLAADGCRRSPNCITPGSSLQASHSPIFQQDAHGKDTANGWTSALPRPWRTHGQNHESCSLQRPTFRQYLPQQLLEDQGHRRHHWNR